MNFVSSLGIVLSPTLQWRKKQCPDLSYDRENVLEVGMVSCCLEFGKQLGKMFYFLIYF